GLGELAVFKEDVARGADDAAGGAPDEVIAAVDGIEGPEAADDGALDAVDTNATSGYFGGVGIVDGQVGDAVIDEFGIVPPGEEPGGAVLHGDIADGESIEDGAELVAAAAHAAADKDGG